ncbi:retrotransposon protein, putative, ty1-copia subclass [Tanacetum coccineum]
MGIRHAKAYTLRGRSSTKLGQRSCPYLHNHILKLKNPKHSVKECPTKDDACHHCKEVGHWKRNYPVYLAELIIKKKQVGTASFLGASGSYWNNKRAKHNVDSTYLWHCRLAHISKKRIEKLQHDGLLKSTDEESFDKCVSCLSDMCQDKLTPPYTPQHNGVSERRNLTLLDMVRSMMNLTTLPLSFWDYAIETAARILNMAPIKKVDKTPYELWYQKVPNLSYLNVCSCEALVKRDTHEKIQQRFVKCIFIGYPKETIGYYLYYPPENKIVVAKYAEFLKKNLLSQEISGRAKELEEIQDEDTSPSENTSKIPMEVEEVEGHSLGDLNEPTNYKAAILDPESDKWVDAMNAEMQSMKDNQV